MGDLAVKAGRVVEVGVHTLFDYVVGRRHGASSTEEGEKWSMLEV